MPGLRMIAITSGKGGVGKTHIAVSFAIEWARLGKRVILVDADLGLANADLLLGIKSKNTMKSVIDGKCSLDSALVKVQPKQWKLPGDSDEGELFFLPGDIGSSDLAVLEPGHQERFLETLQELSGHADIVVFDTGAGLDWNVIRFCQFAGEAVVVTNREPLARRDATVMLNVLQVVSPSPHCWLVPNQVIDELEGRRLFDHLERLCKERLLWGGCVLQDSAVPEAVESRRPVVLHEPQSDAAQSIRDLAHYMVDHAPAGPDGDGDLFDRVRQILHQ
ncbi:MAG: AAA family ATPase [Planctomycetota bacterium]|nr:AAA family ATPase [Planctomycetota bacterium]